MSSAASRTSAAVAPLHPLHHKVSSRATRDLERSAPVSVLDFLARTVTAARLLLDRPLNREWISFLPLTADNQNLEGVRQRLRTALLSVLTIARRPILSRGQI